jgi:FAD-dependent urate hydroxylase
LCAAIALRQAGIDAVVYEQARAIQPVGAGLTLWSNAMRALRKLNAADAVLAAGAVIQYASIRKWDGEVLSRVPLDHFQQKFGEPAVATSAPICTGRCSQCCLKAL